MRKERKDRKSRSGWGVDRKEGRGFEGGKQGVGDVFQAILTMPICLQRLAIDGGP